MRENMKKGKIAMTITIGIACFALVTVMMMQFKVVNETDITAIEDMQEAELKTELANWKTRYEEIDAQYQEVTGRIEEYKNDEQSNNEASQLVQEELEQTNTLLGLTDVHGEGIIITLKSGKDMATITSDDLLVMVNALKFAGAEAISINDQRIINTSKWAENIRTLCYKSNRKSISYGKCGDRNRGKSRRIANIRTYCNH